MTSGESRRTGEPLLRASRLALGYERNIVVCDVDLEIRSGDFWFLLGPNGEGKTTFLRAVLGLLRPREGTLWLHPDLARLDRVGFVPQRSQPNPTLPTTVREFVATGLVGTSVPRREEAERVQWALRTAGLPNQEGRDLWALSGGQRQRALLARALVRQPNLIVLDEPTNGLDLTTEDNLLRFLSDLNQKGYTLLFVTHDVGIAGRYASHVALFHAGHVTAGLRDDILTTERLSAVYGVDVHVSRDHSGHPVIHVAAEEGA